MVLTSKDGDARGSKWARGVEEAVISGKMFYRMHKSRGNQDLTLFTKKYKINMLYFVQ